jgi:hypothetical protein
MTKRLRRFARRKMPVSQANHLTLRSSSSRLFVHGFWAIRGYTECMPESCAAGKDGAAGERALLSRAACCKLLESARLRASQ